MRTLSYLIGLLTALGFRAALADWRDPIRLTDSDGNAYTSFPQTSAQRTVFATSADTVHVVWNDTRGQDEATANVYYKRSLDGGQTWSEDQPLTFHSAQDGSAMNPCIAVSGSTVHVVWQDGELFTLTARIWYLRSLDAGVTWEPAVSIAPEVPAPFSMTSPMIVVSGDQLHLCWSGSTDGLPQTQTRTYYCHSFDGGQTWGEPVQVSEHTPESGLNSIHSTLALSGNAIHLAWASYFYQEPDNYSHIYYSRSLDHGETWSEPVQIEDDPGLSYAPIIAAAPEGLVHLAWEDSRDSWRIWYQRSLDDGVTWEVAGPISPGGGLMSYTPFLELRSTEVHLVYYAFDWTDYDVHYRRSDDGGLTWSPDTVLVENVAMFPSLASSDQRLYIIWTNVYDEEGSEIYYSYHVDGDLPHGPSAFDLRLPEDQAVLSESAARELTCEWNESVDPDSGAAVRYVVHLRVTQQGVPPVVIVHTNIAETRDFMNLLSESGFDPPLDTLRVQWWVEAYSQGDTVQSNSAFRFAVAPSLSGAPERLEPRTFELAGAYPNPFNGGTTIRFSTRGIQDVTVRIYDVLGREVLAQHLSSLAPGDHKYSWTPHQSATGLFLVRLETDTDIRTAKLVHLR